MDDRAARSWHVLVGVTLAVGLGLVLVAILAQPGNRSHDVLTARHLETPEFGPAPARASASDTVAHVWADLRQQSISGGSFLKSLIPTESGAIWLSIVVAVAVGIDTADVLNPQNLEIISMLA